MEPASSRYFVSEVPIPAGHQVPGDPVGIEQGSVPTSHELLKQSGQPEGHICAQPVFVFNCDKMYIKVAILTICKRTAQWH